MKTTGTKAEEGAQNVYDTNRRGGTLLVYFGIMELNRQLMENRTEVTLHRRIRV